MKFTSFSPSTTIILLEEDELIELLARARNWLMLQGSAHKLIPVDDGYLGTLAACQHALAEVSKVSWASTLPFADLEEAIELRNAFQIVAQQMMVTESFARHLLITGSTSVPSETELDSVTNKMVLLLALISFTQIGSDFKDPAFKGVNLDALMSWSMEVGESLDTVPTGWEEDSDDWTDDEDTDDQEVEEDEDNWCSSCGDPETDCICASRFN